MRRIFMVALLTAFCGHAAAQSGIAGANRQLNFAVGRHNVDYFEYDDYGMTSNGVLDSEKGTQNAVRVGFSYQADYEDVSKLYVAASLQVARGQTTYDGYLQSYTTGALTPYTTTSHSTTTDFQFRVGKGFGFAGERVQVTPYLSYAYHEWVRDSRTDPYGYMELYEHQAIGLGLLSQFAFGSRLVASIDLGVAHMLNPEMKIDGGPVFYLGSHPIYSFGVGLDYALSEQWRIHADYREQRFKYGESPVVQGFLEPASKTVLKTFSVGLGLAF